MKNITSKILILAVLLAFGFVSCQRLHEPTSGGGQAKDQPKYDDKLVNTDPNQAGDKN